MLTPKFGGIGHNQLGEPRSPDAEMVVFRRTRRTNPGGMLSRCLNHRPERLKRSSSGFRLCERSAFQTVLIWRSFVSNRGETALHNTRTGCENMFGSTWLRQCVKPGATSTRASDDRRGSQKLSFLEEARNRVGRLEAEASRVSDELRRERDRIAELSLSTHTLPNPLPTRLNVGCGYDIRPHFLNVDNGDWHSPDLVADITNLVMLPSGHFEEIVAQDVLEHIERGKQISTLREWGRLLSPDGVLRCAYQA